MEMPRVAGQARRGANERRVTWTLEGAYHMLTTLRQRRIARHDQERRQRRETALAALGLLLIFACYTIAGTIEWWSLFG